MSSTPFQTRTIQLGNFPPAEFIFLARHACARLGWTFVEDSASKWVWVVPPSYYGDGETFTLEFNGSAMVMESRSNTPRRNDWGKNGKNLETFFGTFNQVRGLQRQTLPPLPGLGERVEAPPSDSPSRKIQVSGFLEVLIPGKQFLFTPLLIYANIAVWILMVATGVHFLMPAGEDLFNWGGNFGPVTVESDAWRLFTSTFLHAGIIHLAMNMYALLGLGFMLESTVGKLPFLFIYLACGIGASAVSVFWNNPTVGVGASGAIFGIAGALFALILIGKDKLFPGEPDLLQRLGMFILPNLFIGFTQPFIDNAAHVGGLLTGFVLGAVMVPVLISRNEGKIKAVASGISIAAIAVAGFLTMNLSQDRWNNSNPMFLFEKEMAQKETRAMAILNNETSFQDSDSIQVAKNLFHEMVVMLKNPELKKNARADALQTLIKYYSLYESFCDDYLIYLENPEANKHMEPGLKKKMEQIGEMAQQFDEEKPAEK